MPDSDLNRPVIDCFVFENGKDLELPAYKSEFAAGMDLRAAIPADGAITLSPGDHRAIPTGIAICLGADYEGQIRPRSGLADKYGVTVLNSPGTIDPDYRGEIGVILINLGRNAFTIHHGDRIAQLVIAPCLQIKLRKAESIGVSSRGMQGFGSTGTK